MSTPRTAQDVITALNLTPHPEKGYYTETFRDTPTTTTPSTSTTASAAQSGEPRAISTAIYYLLERDAGRSHWHRVLDAAEIWHYYAGAPLTLSLSNDDGTPTRDVVLGPDLWKGERPQVIVRKGEWQAARSLGEWTLVGCTVSPGFVFESFEMAEEGWVPREK